MKKIIIEERVSFFVLKFRAVKAIFRFVIIGACFWLFKRKKL